MFIFYWIDYSFLNSKFQLLVLMNIHYNTCWDELWNRTKERHRRGRKRKICCFLPRSCAQIGSFTFYVFLNFVLIARRKRLLFKTSRFVNIKHTFVRRGTWYCWNWGQYHHSCWDIYYLLVIDDKKKNDHVWSTHSLIKSPQKIVDKSMFSYHNNYGSILLSTSWAYWASWTKLKIV